MRAALAQGESLFTFGPEDGCALIMARCCQALALFDPPVPASTLASLPPPPQTSASTPTPPAPTRNDATYQRVSLNR